MSYILDALRRADAERQRGGVPGLHTPGAAVTTEAAPAARRRGPLWLAAGALAVAAAAAAVVLGLGQRARTDGDTAARTPAPPPASSLVSAPASAPVSPVASPVAQAPAVPAPTLVAPAPVVVVVPPALPAASAPVAAPVALPPPAPAPAPAPAQNLQAAPPAAAAQHLPTLVELPEAQRRQVPALALGGGMYSEQPAQRLVIVNGQVAREGDEAAPGVRVLQIRPRSVVFSAGGLRFQMPL